MGEHFVWDLDPVIFELGWWQLRWYSLSFIVGILGGFLITKKMFVAEARPVSLLDPLLMYVIIGMIVGMRVAHVVFYDWSYYSQNLWKIPAIWEGGYASHGGFAGVIIAILLFCRKHREVSFLWVADRLAISSMFCAGFIRIGNFLNSEIIGRPSDVPWAVVLKLVDEQPRHPSQIYEALTYFTISGLAYLVYRSQSRAPVDGRVLGATMIMGFFSRFGLEFFKENQSAFEHEMTLNVGQWLSVPFIIAGIFLLFRRVGFQQSS